MIAPVDLIKIFGSPDQGTFGEETTGEYLFEDNNLDMFMLFDSKQTDYYHGMNREDSFYESPKNLRLPMHKRKRKWPTIEEFWASKEPKQFKLVCDDQADVRKFKRWLAIELRKAK